MIFLILLLNLAISWANCWAVGRIWNDTRALGGWPRLLAWSGAIQAAIGFSSVIGFAVGYIAYATGHLPPHAAKAALSLWYLLIIVPALGTGLIITIQSWIAALRERSLLNMGVAAYNTYAQASNMIGAIGGIGDAWKAVGDLFDSRDNEGAAPAMILTVLALVALALLGGIVLTYALIRKYAATSALPEPDFAKA
jgi:hypothetical protein